MSDAVYDPFSSDELISLTEFDLPDFPLHLDVELTSRCNLNCTFCDKQPLLKASQLGDMSPELFYKIADECGDAGLGSMGMSYRGEPLLNRNIAAYVRHAKSRGVRRVSFCTNGMLLIPDTARKLIDAGLDEVSISAQGATAETFEYTRIGSNFSSVLRNVEYFMDIRASANAKTPEIRIQAVDLPELDKDAFIEFWSKRCDKVVIVPYEAAEDRQTGRHTDWCCPQLWRRMTVEYDGKILPCNNDDIREMSPGNALDMSIRDAWHSNKIQVLRNLHRKGMSHLASDCDGCPFRHSAISQINEFSANE